MVNPQADVFIDFTAGPCKALSPTNSFRSPKEFTSGSQGCFTPVPNAQRQRICVRKLWQCHAMSGPDKEMNLRALMYFDQGEISTSLFLTLESVFMALLQTVGDYSSAAQKLEGGRVQPFQETHTPHARTSDGTCIEFWFGNRRCDFLGCHLQQPGLWPPATRGRGHDIPEVLSRR